MANNIEIIKKRNDNNKIGSKQNGTNQVGYFLANNRKMFVPLQPV